MGSSDAETGMVDCGVGTIVWVRRRNGSWWPGKILGPDELSASHVMSPRSGTPVKLLGREDASVDWYNLEKSKRVKPFRCGEFDDCIERAEASQGMPPKKREKYARREDAILHALELEKQVLEKKHGNSGVQSNGSSTKLLGNKTNMTPEISRTNGKHVDPSLDDKKKGLSSKSRRADSGRRLNVDDKSPDVRPNFRGLQNLDAGHIPFKHKLSSLAASNGSHSHRHAAAAAAAADGVSSLTPENSVVVSSKKLLEKRKRSQEGNMEESVGKRRDRHRPLVQVLQSSAKLPRTPLLQSKADGGEELREAIHIAVGGNDPGMAVKSGDSFDHRETLPDQVEISAPKSFPVALPLSEDNTTGSNEDTETDSSGTESLLSDTYDAMAALSDEAEDMEFIPKVFGRPERQGEESMSDDESGNSAATVSKWQLKGKRNSRSLRKRKVPTSCSQWMIGFKGEDSYGADSNSRNQGIGGYNDNNYYYYNNNSNRAGGGLDMVSWDDQPKGYWDEYHDVMRSMLIDVEVGVQSLGYQREHVPMISLMSKLNDKAIVGHPISVEALEDGSSDIIISDFQMESSPLLASDPPLLLPWRTAKCRVSRQPNLSTLEEEEDEYGYHNEDGKLSAGSLNHSSKGRKWSAPKKLQRKSTSSCSSQKIRTLSSIGGTHQQQQQIMDMKAAGEEGMGLRMMKPESLPTAVACIPVKLVFSRLHEELLVARHQ